MAQPAPVGVGQYGGRFIPRSVVKKNNAALTAAFRYINEHGGQVAGIGLSVSKAVVGNVWNSVNPQWREVLIEAVIQTYVLFLPIPAYTSPLRAIRPGAQQIDVHEIETLK